MPRLRDLAVACRRILSWVQMISAPFGAASPRQGCARAPFNSGAAFPCPVTPPTPGALDSLEAVRARPNPEIEAARNLTRQGLKEAPAWRTRASQESRSVQMGQADLKFENTFRLATLPAEGRPSFERFSWNRLGGGLGRAHGDARADRPMRGPGPLGTWSQWPLLRPTCPPRSNCTRRAASTQQRITSNHPANTTRSAGHGQGRRAML